MGSGVYEGGILCGFGNGKTYRRIRSFGAKQKIPVIGITSAYPSFSLSTKVDLRVRRVTGSQQRTSAEVQYPGFKRRRDLRRNQQFKRSDAFRQIKEPEASCGRNQQYSRIICPFPHEAAEERGSSLSGIEIPILGMAPTFLSRFPCGPSAALPRIAGCTFFAPLWSLHVCRFV